MLARQMTERFLWTIALGAVALLPAAAVAQTPSGSNVHPKGLHCYLSQGVHHLSSVSFCGPL
jgi:hypothetical protein